MLSVPWYFARQGISSDFNLIYGIITAATMFWGLTAGTIVDRFNRKHVFLINNAVEGAILLSVAAYGLSTGNLPTLLIVLVFTTTVFGFYLHYPNLYAFAHEITKEGEYTKVTSAIEIVGQSTNVLAGAGAALLLEGIDIANAWNVGGRSNCSINWQVDPWTIQEIFLMDGITYGCHRPVIALIRYVPAHLDMIDRGAFIQRLRTGFSYLRAHPVHLSVRSVFAQYFRGDAGKAKCADAALHHQSSTGGGKRIRSDGNAVRSGGTDRRCSGRYSLSEFHHRAIHHYHTTAGHRCADAQHADPIGGSISRAWG